MTKISQDSIAIKNDIVKNINLISSTINRREVVNVEEENVVRWVDMNNCYKFK